MTSRTNPLFTVVYNPAGFHCVAARPDQSREALNDIGTPRNWKQDPAAWVAKLDSFTSLAKPGDTLIDNQVVIIRQRTSRG